jgi:methylmalonyl-CoA mutase cobalamin-binding subunit
MDEEKLHPIRYVAQATGLSPHVIRVWERRYGAVRPGRSSKNRRLYSEADIHRLTLLKKARSNGHSISHAASLEPQLLSAVGQDREARREGRPANGNTVGHGNWLPEPHLEACWGSVIGLDAPALTAALGKAAVHLSHTALLTGVISPLFGRIGDAWAAGSLKIVHEHLASAVVEGFLLDLLSSARPLPQAPRMVVATPVEQWCRLGALMAAVLAADLGWQVVYFGAGLPADEVAAAAGMTSARAVSLGIASRMDPHVLARELSRLRRGLGKGVRLLIGGQACTEHLESLAASGAHVFATLNEFIASPALTALSVE